MSERLSMTEAEFKVHMDESFTNGAKAAIATFRGILDELERLADVDIEKLGGGR